MPPFRTYRKLYLAWLLTLLAALVIQLFNDRGDVVLALHAVRIDWVDELFLSITRLGEYQGFILALLMVVLLGNRRHVFVLVVSVVLMMLLIYLFKYKVFQHAERPIVFFERMGILLDFKPDYHLNRKHSFPSGHTAAAFTFFFGAAFATTRFGLQLISLLLAVGVGFSRVYLMQHFVMDTIAGSILGVVLVSGVYALSYRFFMINSGMDRPVLKRNESQT